MSANVILLRRPRTSEWLETLARRPFALHREILLELAEHFRAIEALDDDLDGQLELRERAA